VRPSIPLADRNSRGRLSLANACAALLVAAGGARADPLPDDPLQRKCWTEHTAQRTAVDLRSPTAVRFANLRNGDVIRSPFWIEFGVRGMGVIPAGNPHPRAGHHHLLVDTPLPLNYQDTIPFSDTHRHYGKGQTGTQLELAPGKHRLRLLFADHEHRPYFVYSPEITITVEGKRGDPMPGIDAKNYAATCEAWYRNEISAPRTQAKEVYVKNLRAREAVDSPFVISLGVSGYGVAPANSAVKDTGHFVLAIRQGGTLVKNLALTDGRTETVVDLPRGEYELDLKFIGTDAAPLLSGTPMALVVQRQLGL
jgi:Domain of unknown function (DUF4399)